MLVYTGYIAFTNYGTGHNGSKEQAVSSLMASSLAARRGLADLPRDGRRPVRHARPAGHRPRRRRAASARTSSRSTEVDAEIDGDKAVAVDGWTTLQFADVIARTDEITELAVPFSDDPNDGAAAHARRLERLPLPLDPRVRRGRRHDDRPRRPAPSTPTSAPAPSPPTTARSCCPAGRSSSASTTSCAPSPTSASRGRSST